jgi:hypothetical protein
MLTFQYAPLGHNIKSTANKLKCIVDCLQPQSKNIFAPNKLLSQMLSSRFNKNDNAPYMNEKL